MFPRTNQNCRGTIRAAAKVPAKGQAMVPARVRQGSRHTLKVVYGKVPVDGVSHSPGKRPKQRVPVEGFFLPTPIDINL